MLSQPQSLQAQTAAVVAALKQKGTVTLAKTDLPVMNESNKFYYLETADIWGGGGREVCLLITQ